MIVSYAMHVPRLLHHNLINVSTCSFTHFMHDNVCIYLYYLSKQINTCKIWLTHIVENSYNSLNIKKTKIVERKFIRKQGCCCRDTMEYSSVRWATLGCSSFKFSMNNKFSPFPYHWLNFFSVSIVTNVFGLY